MTRPTPGEGAVRAQMKERDDGAVAEAAAAPDPAAPEAEQPAAPEAEESAAPEEEVPREEAPQEEEQPPADPLAEAEAKRDEYLDLARRTQADFENYRKRTAQQAAQAGQRAKATLLRELLPVVDNLERAEAAAAESEGPLHEGVKLVLADFQGVLTRAGVESLEPLGERFDPTVHEAISTTPQEGTEPGLVVEVVEKGYRSGDTVIRPARVVVSA
jgi:molecular chaperone GrpE